MSDQAEATDTVLWAEADDETALTRYRALADVIDDDGGSFHLDTELRFVAVTDGIVDVTGRPRESLLGDHVSSILERSGA